MKKFWNWLLEVVPIVWSILLIAIITFGAVTCLIAITKWFLILVGVL